MFGPLIVKMFRRQLKRYGIIFTCMTTRAVHLEMVESMEMESFLRAYSRFVVHKGKPTHCYSDNETNFTSAAKEISDGIASWNKAEFISKEATKQTTWHFNPSYAPHFGGAWERLIRSAKTALAAVLHGQTTTDEVLRTALTLVQGLLNSRPLTHVSVDPHDPEALTPYHLLIGRANPYVPLNIVDERDVNCRQRYRAALALAKQFGIAGSGNISRARLNDGNGWNTGETSRSAISSLWLIPNQRKGIGHWEKLRKFLQVLMELCARR